MSCAVVTTSFAPDFERFVRLHASVLEYSDLPHYVFVPEADRELFERIASPSRLVIVTTRDVLPRNFITTEWLNRAVSRVPQAPGALRWAAVNRRRPWPPVRGWVLQQLVKLAAADCVDSDTLVYIDSEIELVRPVYESTFRHGNITRLYRKPDGIDSTMMRHRAWHENARRLIGLPSNEIPPYNDYIGGITSWDAALVRACTSRIGEVVGRPWQTAVGAELEISEYILYGEYVSEFCTEAQLSFISERSLCHSYWGKAPLDRDSARRFVEGMGDDDVAVHVQSNTGTSPEIEEYIRRAVKDLIR